MAPEADNLIAIGAKVKITSDIGSSWNGQIGVVVAYLNSYSQGEHFRYWVKMPILHPTLKQPITIDGIPQELPQMFRPDEVEAINEEPESDNGGYNPDGDILNPNG